MVFDHVKSATRQLVIDADSPEGMKWADFLGAMEAMGFKYDPNPKGEIVQFESPNSDDLPISFEKPFPHQHLTRSMVQSSGTRLKKQYGWINDDFVHGLVGP